MAVARYLADTSALARLHLPPVAARLARSLEAGLVATCGVVELEVGVVARTTREYAERRALRASAYEWLEADDSVWADALEVQASLIQRGTHRGVKLPELIVAAVARQHDVTVVHYDHDFDLIAAVTKQPTEWVVPRGSLS